MEPISVKWENGKVSDIQDQYVSEGKAIVNTEGEESEGRSTLSVRAITEAEDFLQNCDK